MNADNKRLSQILALAVLSLLFLPWYKIRGGFFGFEWLGDLPSKPDLWPGMLQAIIGRWQLWPIVLLVAAAIALRFAWPSGEARGRVMVRLGVIGLIWMVAEGLHKGGVALIA